ncbi:hypothetical protein FOTG_17377 [Fusarium oxysporum f. sp. vasinfectum 25433]|uniref:Uncharacterized protein n=1 Tax=Fusarium oxysporum f. sp. vasinfectum 25433 TaxID=1089449 RepID=X0KZT7_FUSOX|nr:hypothetical protein FOTG_17377 [Fusarium oxysporum f. sp. vasinfectum 25433]
MENTSPREFDTADAAVCIYYWKEFNRFSHDNRCHGSSVLQKF